jgi:anaerobic dimethyl sulfoxide reductase subunit B (iron-sulfur subunit)
LDAGLPPACVAACPLRALDFGDRAELEARYGTVGVMYPLPEFDLTQPALVLTPHQDAARAAHESAQIGNWEEVKGK